MWGVILVLEGRIGQYVFISTISVYTANDTPADETVPLVAYKGDDPMAETIKSLNANKRLYAPLKALSDKEAQNPDGIGQSGRTLTPRTGNASEGQTARSGGW